MNNELTKAKCSCACKSRKGLGVGGWIIMVIVLTLFFNGNRNFVDTRLDDIKRNIARTCQGTPNVQ